MFIRFTTHCVNSLWSSLILWRTTMCHLLNHHLLWKNPPCPALWICPKIVDMGYSVYHHVCLTNIYFATGNTTNYKPCGFWHVVCFNRLGVKHIVIVFCRSKNHRVLIWQTSNFSNPRWKKILSTLLAGGCVFFVAEVALRPIYAFIHIYIYTIYIYIYLLYIIYYIIFYFILLYYIIYIYMFLYYIYTCIYTANAWALPGTATTTGNTSSSS